MAKQKEKTTVTSVRLPESLMQEVSDKAKKNFRSINAEIFYRLRKSIESENRAA